MKQKLVNEKYDDLYSLEMSILQIFLVQRFGCIDLTQERIEHKRVLNDGMYGRA